MKKKDTKLDRILRNERGQQEEGKERVRGMNRIKVYYMHGKNVMLKHIVVYR